MTRVARLEPAGVLDFRRRIWAVVRLMGTFSVAEVMVMAGQPLDTVSSYLTGLQKAGYLSCIGPRVPHLAKHRALRMFSLVRDVGVDAPQVYKDGKPITRGIGHERLWNAMRRHKGDFTWRDIALHASTEGRPIAEQTAKDYLKYVARAGYLRTVSPAQSNKRPALYSFIRARDTGPRAPIITSGNRVQDGNTGEIVLNGGANG